MAIAVACVLLATATLLFIFYIETGPEDAAPHRSRLDQLLERRDTIYENLRDLKFEYRAGKFSEKDYEETREALETEAALVLAEIEKVTGAPRALGSSPQGKPMGVAARSAERSKSHL